MEAIRKLLTLFLGAVLMLLASVVRAASVFDPLTAAVSFTDVIAALFAIAAILMGVLVSRKGISWVLAMIGRK